METLRVPPRRWAQGIPVAVGLMVGNLAFYFFRHGHVEPLLALASGLVGLGVGAIWKLPDVTVEGGRVSGPALYGRWCVSIPINEIDLARSSKRDLLGGRRIWSHRQAKVFIYLSPLTIPKRGRLRILRAIGLDGI